MNLIIGYSIYRSGCGIRGPGPGPRTRRGHRRRAPLQPRNRSPRFFLAPRKGEYDCLHHLKGRASVYTAGIEHGGLDGFAKFEVAALDQRFVGPPRAPLAALYLAIGLELGEKEDWYRGRKEGPLLIPAGSGGRPRACRARPLAPLRQLNASSQLTVATAILSIATPLALTVGRGVPASSGVRLGVRHKAPHLRPRGSVHAVVAPTRVSVRRRGAGGAGARTRRRQRQHGTASAM